MERVRAAAALLVTPADYECYLENRSGKHFKFWRANMRLDNARVVVEVRWGRIYTNGQTQTKEFPSPIQAREFIRSKRDEKLGRGYVISIVPTWSSPVVGPAVDVRKGPTHHAAPARPKRQVVSEAPRERVRRIRFEDD